FLLSCCCTCRCLFSTSSYPSPGAPSIAHFAMGGMNNRPCSCRGLLVVLLLYLPLLVLLQQPPISGCPIHRALRDGCDEQPPVSHEPVSGGFVFLLTLIRRRRMPSFFLSLSP